MKKHAAIFCILLIVTGILFLIHNLYSVNKNLALSSNSNLVDTKVEHSSHLFDPAFFSQAYDKGEQYKKTTTSRVFGGIIPHHLLAAPLIAGFFEGIANQKIDSVILLSPNHHGVGNYNISTSKGVWTTIFGNLETDTPKITQLIHDQAAFISEDLFDNEHGIYGITPFIKKTFPNAKMIPIVIKAYTPKEECDKLVTSLNKIIDDHTIVIVSADFSHYLTSDQADIHDKESITAIESFDANRIYNLPDKANVDSPGSVYTLIKLMQLKNAKEPILIENTNSAKLTIQPNIPSTTSYVTVYFIKQETNLSRDSIFRLAYIEDNLSQFLQFSLSLFGL